MLEERWTIVINHNLLDDISNQTTEVRALLEQKEYEHAAAQLAVVKTLFRDLSDQYKFSGEHLLIERKACNYKNRTVL